MRCAGRGTGTAEDMLDDDGPHAPADALISALISEADREIDLEVTGFETIPKIEA